MNQALDAGSITKIGLAVIIGLLIIGFLLSLVVTAIVGRVLIFVVVIVLAAFVWQQRSNVQHKIDKKVCDLTFFGIHLDPPDSLKRCR